MVDGEVDKLSEHDPTQLGSYKIAGRLGSGGMGQVYLGRTPEGRPVAIKVVRPELARDPHFRTRFRREAAAARRVARFCTAEVLDADPDGPLPYLVTEYIAGPTLTEAVAAEGAMSGAALEQLAVAVASALSAIHAAGLVHRDLKPDNVLLSKLGPRVIDFGIASAMDAATVITDQAHILGTPAFMAPEQTRGQRASPAVDIFAWGGVVIFAATGRLPFGEAATPVLLSLIATSEPDLTDLPDDLRPIVELAMHKDPARRPSAEALHTLLVDGLTRRDVTGDAPSGDTGPAERPAARPATSPAARPADSGPADSGPADPGPAGAAATPRRPGRRPRFALASVLAAATAVAVGVWQLSPGGGTGQASTGPRTPSAQPTHAPPTSPTTRAPAGAFSTPKRPASSGPTTSTSAALPARPAPDGDVDGDGQVDVLSVPAAGRLTVRYSGGGTDAVDLPAAFPGDQKVLGAVDVDGDGHAEVFVQVFQGASVLNNTVLRYAGGHLRQVTLDGEPATLGSGVSSVTSGFQWACNLATHRVLLISTSSANDPQKQRTEVTRYRFVDRTLVRVAKQAYVGANTPMPGVPTPLACGSVPTAS